MLGKPLSANAKWLIDAFGAPRVGTSGDSDQGQEDIVYIN